MLMQLQVKVDDLAHAGLTAILQTSEQMFTSRFDLCQSSFFGQQPMS
jgi:hypothetical protein